MKVAVIGAGAWGTTLAAALAPRADSWLWAREPDVVTAIREQGENTPFLAGFELPPALHVTGDLDEATSGAAVVVVVVPSQHLRATIATAAVPPDATVVSATKGIELSTGLRMSEVLAEVLPAHDPAAIGVLSGPNLAREVIAGQPAAACVAFPDGGHADVVQRLLMTDSFRIYTSDDVIGCEVGGAAKNVIAIAAGVADGLGYGMNTKAALMTRGLAELTRLGVALGGRPLTFLGLAGNGDLVATCSSPLSRNHQVGVELAKGRSLDDIRRDVSSIAEGVVTAPALVAMAARVGVEMPISAAVVALLAGELDPSELVTALMRRAPRAELDGLDA